MERADYRHPQKKIDLLYNDNMWIYKTGTTNPFLNSKRSMINVMEGTTSMVVPFHR